eukprot:7045166-Prymnesium_polylepis.1
MAPMSHFLKIWLIFCRRPTHFPRDSLLPFCASRRGQTASYSAIRMQPNLEKMRFRGHLVCIWRLCIAVAVERCTNILTRSPFVALKRRATRRDCVGQAPSVRPQVTADPPERHVLRPSTSGAGFAAEKPPSRRGGVAPSPAHDPPNRWRRDAERT